ncbi:hypothetical protein DPMN_129722 [Dreissena polymorpha]|uniref:Uncharacterized protein n=3 Tax=Dreissena polymorpha TaxID=45954 RepID=A0A9D4JYI3_DREPO|nr:hypothetical protein DPMN_129722 [Dreissena polymorpha]
MSSTRSVNPPRSRIPVPLESGNTSTKPVRSGTQSMRTSQRPMKATHDDNGVAHSSTAKKALSPIYSESETSSPDSSKRWKSIPLRSKQNTPRYKPSINDKTHESTLIAKNVNQMKSETSFNSSLEPRSCISIPVKVEFEIKVNPKYANQNKSIVDQVANKQSNHGASCKRTVANIKDILKTVLTCLKTGKHFAKVDISFDFKPDSLGQKQSLPGTMRRLPMPVDMKDISAIDIDLAVWAPRFLDISHADNDIQYAKSPMGTLHDMQGVAFTSRGSLFTPLMCSTPRVDELIYGVCETITKHDGVNWREAEIVSPGERYHLQKPAVAISKRPDNVPRLNILVSPVGRNDTRFMQMFDDSSDLSTDRSFTLQRSIENSWQDYSRPMMQVRPPFVPRLNLRDLEGFELHSKKKCAPTFRASDSQSNENVPVFKRHTSLNKDTGQQKELVQR